MGRGSTMYDHKKYERGFSKMNNQSQGLRRERRDQNEFVANMKSLHLSGTVFSLNGSKSGEWRRNRFLCICYQKLIIQRKRRFAINWRTHCQCWGGGMMMPKTVRREYCNSMVCLFYNRKSAKDRLGSAHVQGLHLWDWQRLYNVCVCGYVKWFMLW